MTVIHISSFSDLIPKVLLCEDAQDPKLRAILYDASAGVLYNLVYPTSTDYSQADILVNCQKEVNEVIGSILDSESAEDAILEVVVDSTLKLLAKAFISQGLPTETFALTGQLLRKVRTSIKALANASWSSIYFAL